MQKAKSIIEESNKIGIFMHINADADSIGSSIALKIALEKINKKVVLFSDGDIHENYNFMGVNEHYKSAEDFTSFDLAILLDCPNNNRIAKAKIFNRINRKLVLDHHLNNDIVADHKIIDINSGCTGVLIYRLIKYMDIEFDYDICTCIYSAIISDTGSFSYDNVTREIFNIAARCLEYNVNTSKISYYLINRKTKNQLKNFQEIISKFEYYNNIAICVINYEFIQESGNDSFDTYSALKFIDGLEGIKLFILMTERRKNVFNVSFRSRLIDTTKISRLFNGGGHSSASGCVIKGSGLDIKNILLNEGRQVIG